MLERKQTEIVTFFYVYSFFFPSCLRQYQNGSMIVQARSVKNNLRDARPLGVPKCNEILLVQALPVTMPNALHTLPLRAVQHAVHRIESLVQIRHRRAEREPHEVVAGRVEEVAPVGRVHVEEDTGDDDRLLLEQLLEEREAVVQGRREPLEVEPDVEGRGGRDLDLEPDLGEPLEDVVALHLEMLLECNLKGETGQDGGTRSRDRRSYLLLVYMLRI